MLERVTIPDGVVIYVSPLLRAAGVPHAFSTRLGGISPPPFDSMNLGNPNGCAIQDDYAHIWANYRALQSAAGCGGRELCRVHQVHGPVVVRARAGEPFDADQKADAIVTDDPARVASVRVADCVPVLLSTADGRTVAAVHAGWRGVIAGVVGAAVAEVRGDAASAQSDGPAEAGGPAGADERHRARMQGLASTPLIAAIGPCIGYDAFEVGPEVLAQFRQALGDAAPVRDTPDGKGRVDLREAIRLQLIGLGMAPDAIDGTDRCTFRDRGEFFSHRRDNGVTGRMAAIVSPA